MASYLKFKFKVRQCQAKKKATSDVVSSQPVNINQVVGVGGQSSHSSSWSPEAEKGRRRRRAWELPGGGQCGQEEAGGGEDAEGEGQEGCQETAPDGCPTPS